ncbi:TPA: DUF2946 domain-containing protein [Enterobacter hormaechei subsp. hoffmannii]|uniref:DUF2946 domain-containing protein n=9 Tax=Enterobacteriaceae TaxID=543 RepID=A0A4D5XM20_9ENTR|nr:MULTISPECIES: DUF2946 domain-containing protein [Enterobacterales]MDT8693483.1 DUF2946 domain-containing protein [Citrobacter freundii]ESC02547.1 putative transmembrane protein [Salmonella enterica subsp. enterica serovar Senftenberg str. 361154004]MCC8233121.1 DUF2946 domain-containing protein [Enterobacter mori]MCC8242492.1 DUF2946 domain-containing protein [Enterobacter mori]MCE1325772.1 DUF2946 domain-containing protein [Enterobacter asburiae]
MLSLFSLSRRQFPIYLALLAILMLFVAPVISKSLEHQRASQPCSAAITTTHNDMPDTAAMHHAMPGMEHDLHSSLDSACAVSQSMSHHLASNPGSSPMEDIACGYCQLLIHLPLIQTVFIPFIWLILLVSQAPFLPVIVSPLLSACYSKCQPRAPPSLFSLR